MMSDQSARAVVLEAFALRSLPPPTLPEAQGVQAIGRFEGRYGSAFGGANNWGSVQCSHGPPCGGACVEATDSHADGSKYQWCYRRYATPAEGAADLVRQLYRRAGVPDALRAGDATAIATAMRATGYFEAPVTRYAGAIENNAHVIAGALGEPWSVRSGGVAPPAPLPAPPAPLIVEPSAAAAGGGALALVALLGLAALARSRSQRSAA